MSDSEELPDAQIDEASVAASHVSDPTAFIQLSAKLKGALRPNSAQGESMATLRNYLISQHVRDGRRALALCGTTANSGCTYVATNLALAAARAGLNTLLIDTNMRDPGVDQMFITNEPTEGLKQYLQADDNVPPLVMAQVVPRLSILFAGGVADDAQELLSSPRLARLLEDSVRTFDLTIADCPPAANYSDARRVASLLRHAAIVVRRDHTLSHDVRTLVDELRSDRVNIVGTVLNVTG